MFFFAALFVGAFILSLFLTPKAKVENARASSLSDFQFPRAKEGDPVPRGYGTWKTKGPNTIYAGDFEAKAITKKVKTGLFSSKRQTIGYQYRLGLDLAVALGPNVTFRRMWFGKNEVWNGCLDSGETNQITLNLPELYGGQDRNGGVGGTVTFFGGNFDQAQSSYLVSKLGPGVPAYVGVAHAVFHKFWFGNSAQIEPISFELSHFSNSLGFVGQTKHIMPNGLDANPIEVLHDLYVNDWGNLDVDEGLIDLPNWIEAAETIWDEANGISVEIANPQEGKEITKEVLRQINAMIYQDPTTGYIRIKLIREDYNVDTLPVYGPSELKIVRNYTVKLWEDTINRVRVKYQDRARQWKEDAVAVADDFANIRYQDRIRAIDIGMPCCKEANLANMLAARELANLNVPLFQAEVESNRTAVPLGPGDVFKLNWPEYNIESMVVRIRKFGLGSLEDGKVTMTVVQDEFAADQTVYASPESTDTGEEAPIPTAINAFRIFELPYFLNNAAGFPIVPDTTRLAAFAKKPGPASLDYFMMINDTTEDIEVLSNAPYSESANLVTPIARWDAFANGIIPIVVIDSVTDTGKLLISDAAGVRTGVNLFYLGTELMAFETFVDNLDGTYNLVNVHRALLDTAPAAHTAASTLFFFDGQEGFAEDDITLGAIDSYLLDRSVFGRSLEADAVVSNMTLVGRRLLPAPADYITIEANRATDSFVTVGHILTIDWRERNRTNTGIAFESDLTDTQESGITYTLEIVRGVTTLHSAPGLVGTTHELTIPAVDPGAAELRIWSLQGTTPSFTAAAYPIVIVTGDSMLIDDDPVTVDGNTIEFT